jgi:hypothetical protein
MPFDQLRALVVALIEMIERGEPRRHPKVDEAAAAAEAEAAAREFDMAPTTYRPAPRQLAACPPVARKVPITRRPPVLRKPPTRFPTLDTALAELSAEQ